MTKATITNTIPPPSSRGGRPRKWDWESMVPGDSFFAPGYCTAGGVGLTQMGVDAGKRVHPGSTWTMRTLVEDGVQGVRVWRLT